MERVKLLTQAYTQAPWRKQVQLIVGFAAGVILIALVAGVYLNVTARAVAIGNDIQNMQVVIQNMERTNADLESQLAQITSSKVMEDRADSMGFEPIKPEQIVYVSVPGYTDRQVANLAPPPDPVVVTAPGLSPAFTESLVDWLRDNVLLPSGFLNNGVLP